MRTITRDYTGRQVDLEVLQTVQAPVGTVDMSLTAVTGASRRVAGVQKAIQRYVTLFLTPSSSVPFPYAENNILLDELSAGRVGDAGYLRHLFNMANAATLDTIRRDDYNTDRFGALEDDERIESVDLGGITLDYGTSTVGLSLVFRTAAGEDYAYVIPVSARRG